MLAPAKSSPIGSKRPPKCSARNASVTAEKETEFSASYNFEMGLWRDRSDPEGLYERCFREVGIEVGESDWAESSFRSIDPVYVHNFIIGHIFAAAVLDHLRNEISADVSPEWGQWLLANYLQSGGAESLPQKAEALGDRSPFRLTTWRAARRSRRSGRACDDQRVSSARGTTSRALWGHRRVTGRRAVPRPDFHVLHASRALTAYQVRRTAGTSRRRPSTRRRSRCASFGFLSAEARQKKAPRPWPSPTRPVTAAAVKYSVSSDMVYLLAPACSIPKPVCRVKNAPYGPNHGPTGPRHVHYASRVEMSQAWAASTEDSERIRSPGR